MSKSKIRHEYEVVCGYLGVVYSGHSRKAAARAYREKVAYIRGRGIRSSVTVFRDGENVKEFDMELAWGWACSPNTRAQSGEYRAEVMFPR